MATARKSGRTAAKTARKTAAQQRAEDDRPTATEGSAADATTAREKADLRDSRTGKSGYSIAQDAAVSDEEKERRLEALSDDQRKRREAKKPEKELVPQIQIDRRTMAAYQPVVRPGSTEPIVPEDEDEVPAKAKPREEGATDRKLALAEEVEPDPIGAGRQATS